jgi:hypothetical protein
MPLYIKACYKVENTSRVLKTLIAIFRLRTSRSPSAASRISNYYGSSQPSVYRTCPLNLYCVDSPFLDASDPRPLVTVRHHSDTGSMEIQDVLSTVQGPTAGAVLMEWNIKADS